MKETTEFINKFVYYNPTYSFAYDNAQGLDLSKCVGLLAWTGNSYKTLEELGFEGVKYTYTLPEKYLGGDGTTNQQWFVELNGSVLSINKKNLQAPYTQAIGRTPVVRVDAYVPDSKGNDVMVYSSYVKVRIVEKDLSGDNKNIEVNLPVKETGYASNSNNVYYFTDMGYQDVNNLIYAPAGLTANTFWNYYYYSGYKVTVLGNDSKEIENPQGVSVDVAENWSTTMTSCIKIGTNATVHTENYTVDGQKQYKNVDGKGARYTVTITFKAQPNIVAQDVVITQVFYVKDNVVAYPINPNYEAGTNTVKSKGTLVNDAWSFTMPIADAYKKLNIGTDKAPNYVDIWSYYNVAAGYKVVKAMPAFAINQKPDANKNGVELTASTQGNIRLTEPLAATQKSTDLTYTIVMKNGETKSFPLTVIFQNPFVAASADNGVTINGNSVADVKESVNPYVNVDDLDGKDIYNWIAKSKALVLSDLATKTYKLAAPTVTYAFDKNEQAYKDFVNQLPDGAKIEVDGDGNVKYVSAGASLVPSFTLHVNVTVSFGNISKVVCKVPVKINGSGK